MAELPMRTVEGRNATGTLAMVVFGAAVAAGTYPTVFMRETMMFPIPGVVLLGPEPGAAPGPGEGAGGLSGLGPLEGGGGLSAGRLLGGGLPPVAVGGLPPGGLLF